MVTCCTGAQQHELCEFGTRCAEHVTELRRAARPSDPSPTRMQTTRRCLGADLDAFRDLP